VARIVLELNEPATLWEVTGSGGRYALTLFEGTYAQAQAKREALEREAREREARQRAQELAQAQQRKDPAPDGEPRGEGPLAGRVVMIDPGHGGSDPGAIGPYGTFEKEVNLAIALFLGALLEEAGAVVHYTRAEDVYVSIFERPQMARDAGAEIMVSVHANAYLDDRIARGTETLYNPGNGQNKVLAQYLQTEIVKELQLYDRGLRQRTDLAVLNGSTIPTALVEVAFINHPDEEVLLRAPGFQAAAAQGIFNGIERYFAEEFPEEE
jgi:N-acetylmuramoyl-L-alanine amidase